MAKAPLSVAAATRLKHSPLRPPAKHPSWPSQHQVHHNAVPHVQLPLLPSSNAGSTDDMIKPHVDDELPLDLIHLFSDDETQIFGPTSTCSSELGLVSTGTRLGGPWPPCSDPLMPAHSAPEGSVHGMQLLRPLTEAAPGSMSEPLLALDGAWDMKGHMQQCMRPVIKTEPQRPDLRHTLKPDPLDHDFPSSRQQGHLANMGPSKQLPMLGSPWELKTEVPRGMPQGQQLLGSFRHSSPRATFRSAQPSMWPAQGGSSAAHAAWGPASRMPMHEAQHCMARPPAGAPPALLPAGRTDIHGHGSHGHSAWCCAPSIVETSDDLLQQLLGGSDEPRWEQPLSGSNNTNDMYMHRWHSC